MSVAEDLQRIKKLKLKELGNDTSMMGSADRICNMLGWWDRLILRSPLWAARLFVELEKDLLSLRPKNWQKLENEPPRSLFFNVSEFCNARCSFCCYGKSKPRCHMNNKIFFKAAEEYRVAGGKRIMLSALTGEPLLDPSFFEKTAFIRSLGGFDSIDLTTNGILLGQEGVVESLLESGISKLHISTVGFEKIMYEKGMGVGKYDEFLSGASRLLQRNQECGNPILIEFDIRGSIYAVSTRDFSTKILSFIDSSEGKVTVRFGRLFIDWMGQVGSDDIPENCGFLPRNHIRTKPCSYAFDLAVLADGNLRLCPGPYGKKGRVDDLILGNIRDESLANVWSSEATRKVRRTTWGANSNEVCKACLWYSPV